MVGSRELHDCLEDKVVEAIRKKPTTVLVDQQVVYPGGVMDVLWFKKDVDGELVVRYYEIKSGSVKGAKRQAKSFYRSFSHIPTAKVVVVTPGYVRRIKR